jgi:hypothetical protein
MLPEENMAPGQQNFPNKDGDNQLKTPDGQDIITGSRREDQLDALKKQAKDDPSTNDEGASPGGNQDEHKNDLSQNDIKNGINTFEQSSEPHAALETPEGKNNGAKPTAFDGQQSSHT